MARVFLESEIRTGMVPTQNGFALARDILTTTAQSLLDRGAIAGIRITGSVARGNPNRRSDIDFTAISLNQEGDTELVQMGSAIEERTGIKTDGFAVRPGEGGRFDTVNLTLFRKSPRGGNIIGSDPFDFIEARQEDPIEILGRYLDTKRRFLTENYPRRGSLRYRQALEEIFNIRKKVALKTSGALELSGVPAYEYSKVIYCNEAVASLATGLKAEDQLYSAVLNGVLRSECTLKEYRLYIDQMAERVYPHAIDFITLCELYIPERARYFIDQL